MKKIAILLLVIGLLTLAAGCGDDDDDGGTAASPPSAAKEEAAMKKEKEAKQKEETAMKKEEAAMKEEEAAAGATKIALADSEFGEILYDSNDQAIYIFENDTEGQSNCYGECAAAWPPVFTSAKPQAGAGVDASLLGTTKRRDGRLQVTYDGQPLYFYAHEGRGEVRCHNVNLNGGFWWVIGPDGERRP
jgi:predicted lipoprotein with Yx(FWY)xxD motif